MADAAYELWDVGDQFAEKARRSERFVGLLASSLASLPYYHAAVLMLRDTIYGYSKLKDEKPADLMRDYGVVEEFRVGAVEMLSYFGYLLAARPKHFLKDCHGLPLIEAMRKAFLATRA